MSIDRFGHVAIPRFVGVTPCSLRGVKGPAAEERFSDGGSNRWAKQAWEPERKGMTAASKCLPPGKLPYREICHESNLSKQWGETDAPREETVKCTEEKWRGRGPSTYARVVEITLGRAMLQQGLAATCKDMVHRENRKHHEEPGSAHESV